MVEFSALTQKAILNRIIKCVLVKQFVWNTLFWLFEKNWFFTFLTQHCISKKNKNLKKWEKINFDGLFELAIDILVGIEYLNVKIG